VSLFDWSKVVVLCWCLLKAGGGCVCGCSMQRCCCVVLCFAVTGQKVVPCTAAQHEVEQLEQQLETLQVGCITGRVGLGGVHADLEASRKQLTAAPPQCAFLLESVGSVHADSKTSIKQLCCSMYRLAVACAVFCPCRSPWAVCVLNQRPAYSSCTVSTCCVFCCAFAGVLGECAGRPRGQHTATVSPQHVVFCADGNLWAVYGLTWRPAQSSFAVSTCSMLCSVVSLQESLGNVRVHTPQRQLKAESLTQCIVFVCCACRSPWGVCVLTLRPAYGSCSRSSTRRQSCSTACRRQRQHWLR
jgi:hypothetical protein